MVESNLGTPVSPTLANPFQDIDDASVTKAFEMGIVNGRTPSMFDPQASITRQEIAAMMMRAARYLDAATGSAYVETAGSTLPAFPDEAAISNWALPDVRLANGLGIMRGQGGNQINPLGNTTIQESILLVLRLYKGFAVAGICRSRPNANPLGNPDSGADTHTHTHTCNHTHTHTRNHTHTWCHANTHTR